MDEEKKKSLKDLKADLLGIVMSNPNQMNVNSLMSDYRSTVGSSIPIHKYGYKNVNTFLREECTDILKLSGDQYNPVLIPVVTEEVRHVNELIHKQRTSSNRRAPRRVIGVMQKTYPSNRSNQTSYPANRSYSSSSNNYSQNTNSNTYSSSHKRNSSLSGNGYKTRSPETRNNTNYSYNFTSNNKYNNQSTSPTKFSSSYNGSSFKKVPSDNSLPKPKPLLETHINKPNLVTTSSKTESQTASNAEANKKSQYGDFPKNHRVNNKLIDNLKELMTAYPSGLWCRELLHAYKLKYLVDLNPLRIGYNTLILMCKDLPMIFKITRPSQTGDWRLFPPDAEIPSKYHDGADDVQQNDEDEETAREFTVDDLVFGSQALPGVKINASLYPDDCAKYGECIHEPLPIPNVLLLQICEVRDPSHFWFQVVSKSTSVALETIMDEMTEFYKFNPAAKEYKMVRGAAMTGQLCAVPYGEEERYHRAVIIKNVTVDVVKVFYVDYGTVDDVEFSKVHMLLNDFCDVAVQAHRGRLGGVAPKGEQWSGKAKERFMELISDKQLTGQVLSRTEDRNCIISLKLDDHYEEIDIGALLVSEGLAVVDDGKISVKSYYLSFDDLEEGKVVEIPMEDDTTPLEEEEVDDEIIIQQAIVTDEPDDKKLLLEDVQKESNLLSINVYDSTIEVQSNPTEELDSPEVKLKDQEQTNDLEDALARFADIAELNRAKSRQRANSLEDGLLEFQKNQFLFNQQQQCYAYQQQEYNAQFLNPYAASFLPYPQMGPAFPPMQQHPYPPMMGMTQQQMPIPQFNNNINNPPMPSIPQYNRNFWQNLNRQPPNFPFARPPPPPMGQVQGANLYFQPKTAPNHIVRLKRSDNVVPQTFHDNRNKVFEWDKIVKSLNMEKVKNNSKINVESIRELSNTQCKLIYKPLDSIEDSKPDKSFEENSTTDSVKQNKSLGDTDGSESLTRDKSFGESSGNDSIKRDKSFDEDELESLSSDDEEIVRRESSVDECILTLIDVTDAFGEEIEIWSMKNKYYVILQQSAKAFFKNLDVENVYKDCEESPARCLYTMIQDKNNVIANVILSKINQTGGSGVMKGSVVHLNNNKEIDKALPYIVLIPIEKLSDVLCTNLDNVKYSTYELMEYTMSLYSKYVSSDIEVQCSDSESDSCDSEL